jgi:hypothetical protein
MAIEIVVAVRVNSIPIDYRVRINFNLTGSSRSGLPARLWRDSLIWRSKCKSAPSRDPISPLESWKLTVRIERWDPTRIQRKIAHPYRKQVRNRQAGIAA